MSAPARARIWRVAVAVAVAGFCVVVARFHHPVFGFTSFLQLDASNDETKVSALREHPVFVHRDTGGYDGLYYAQLATDPTLADPELPRAMDNFSYRARRILPAATAWMLGAGDTARVIAAYSVINVIAWLALAALLARCLPVNDGRSLLAWCGVLFSAGALSSVRLALTDLIATVLIAGGIFAAETSRRRSALSLVAGATLARETAVLAAAGLVKPPWRSWKNAVRLVLVALPLAAWLLYVRFRSGPADAGWSNLSWPVVGLIEKWGAGMTAVLSLDDQSLAWTSLLATAALTVQAAYLAWHPRWRDRWWRVGAAYGVLMLTLGTAVWEGFPGAATRVLLPLTLAFNVVAVRARAAVIWLMFGNLGILAGLLAMRDVPRDPLEIAAVRRGDTVCVARYGEGWSGPEHRGRHAWNWTSQAATVKVETWSPPPVRVRLEFTLRSLNDRRVVLTQGGREIWRAEIGASPSRHVVELTLPARETAVEFSTPAPGLPEGTGADSRLLAFALYDLRLAVPEP